MGNRLSEAITFHKAGRYDEAEALYDALLSENPSDPNALHLKGLICLIRKDLMVAKDLVGRALAIKEDAPSFHHNYANILAQLGQLEEAKAHYLRALELEPRYAEAYFNLSGTVKFTPDDPTIANAEALLEGGGLEKRDLCFLHFALGKMRDDVGDYFAAFHHIHKGNRLRAELDGVSDPLGDRMFHDRVTMAFSAERIAALKGMGDPSEVPVFVVGMPRSGSSLVEQVLACHPEAHGMGELPDINAIAHTLPKYLGGTVYPACASKLHGDILKGFSQEYLKRLTKDAPQAKRIVDKNLLNYRHLGLIALMFPNAKIIHTRRHPLDTCVSSYFQNFTSSHEYSRDLAHLGLYYRGYDALMHHWKQVLPLNILEFRYEDAVREPEPALRRLVEFCGLEWSDDCLSPEKSTHPVLTASRWQVRQPLYTTSTDRWKRYEPYLGLLRDILEPVVAEYEG